MIFWVGFIGVLALTWNVEDLTVIESSVGYLVCGLLMGWSITRSYRR